jgi:hypothetical protein
MRAASPIPTDLADDALWRMVTDYSETSGDFRFQFMSNEREFPSVIPELRKTIKPGGVFLGVGPEQNFTYIAATQPALAFVFDIRRQNMIEHLVYKSVFEISTDRVDFVSKLFSRKVPPGLAGRVTARTTAQTLFQAFGAAAPDPQLFRQNLQTIKDRLLKTHHFPLSAADLSDIDYIYQDFFNAGGVISYTNRNVGGTNNNYGALMSSTDAQGQESSFLSSDESFQFVREMQRKNLIVPLVGDFAGTKAIRAVGAYLKDHGATAGIFYTSNVEQYLFQQGDDWSRYYANVATLPLDASSTFIRSSHFAFNNGQQRQTPGTSYYMLLCSMKDLVMAFNTGRIRSYDDVIRLSH